MLGYSKEDLDNASYGVRLALDALSDKPARYSKEDLKNIQGLARDGLLVAQKVLASLWEEVLTND
jgi:hypothetical protein